MAATKTIEELIHQCLCYDPEKGELFWKRRNEKMFSGSVKRSASHIAANWNSRNAGKPAFTAIGSHGYRTGTFNGKRFLLHRVAFLLQTGEWPKHTIDHVNGDRLDNRWSNLRQATRGQNNRNAKSYSKSSPYIGVSWNKSLKGYVSKIYSNGTEHYCGFSKTDPERLARKRDEKAKELFGEYARLNF